LIAGATPDWWFPGRELVDAVALQTALGAGHSGAAFDHFARALRRFEAVDPYAGAWLVAECANGLEQAGLPAIAVTRRLASEQRHGLSPTSPTRSRRTRAHHFTGGAVCAGHVAARLTGRRANLWRQCPDIGV
jgi:hypothetical protein